MPSSALLSVRMLRRIRVPRLYLGLAAGFFLVSAGCVKRESPVQAGNREQVLHLNVSYEVTELDPHLVTGLAETRVLSALFEGLVGPDPVDSHPIPAVAESWEISPDGLKYTFHLRASARWSDGSPVTAQDFIASWRRALTPSLAADYANLLYVIQGAEAFNKGAAAFEQVGLAALDARTLRVTLDHPTPYFLSLLTNMVWFPVPLRVIEKNGPADQRGNPWTRPERIVSNGPFNLTAWKQNQFIIVEKSKTYWDAAQVRLNAIHFYPIDSLDVEERAFRTGQLHLTGSVPAAKIETYRRDAPQLLRIDPFLDTYFYRFNLRRAPFGDVRIRRALALAVDRAAIVNKVLHGLYLPATGLTPPNTAGYTFTASPGLPTDFDAARRLLADAGYPGGKGLPVVEILYNNNENHRLIAEAIQEMWRRELGVEARLASQELKITFTARSTGDFQILRSDWVGDYNDPATFLEIFRSDSGNNYTGWASPEYDSLLFAAARTLDPAARFALFQKAEALLLEAAPIIPIFYYTHVFLAQPSVKGWHPTLLDVHPFKYVWLEP